jgi:hypothetical protein
MKFDKKQDILFKYIKNNLNRILSKDLKLIEGLDNTEFIDFADSKYTYTIAKQDITQDLIDEYMSKVETCDENLEDFVFKHVYQISLNKREVY